LNLDSLPANIPVIVGLSGNDEVLNSPVVSKYIDIINRKRENDKLVFHSFWRVPRNFGLKQVSVIKSIIVSHKHKLDKIEINLWSNVDLSDNPYFQEISK
jgi:hypothetical protein